MEEKKYPNSGRMFKNSRKEKDSHPDGDGDAEIDCEKCGHNNRLFLNSWRKPKDKNGDPWYSIAFKHKKPKQSQDSAPTQTRTATQGNLGYGSGSGGGAGSKPHSFNERIDDDIPFAPEFR